jgi:hypothetical protein
MPSPNTFSIEPIKMLAERWLEGRTKSADPFARNSGLCLHTNDLDPTTLATDHMGAVEYLDMLLDSLGADSLDAVILDPPYSPRQVQECYGGIGKTVTMKDTQTGRLYKECKLRITKLLRVGGVCITCGWQSAGVGKKNGFEIREILLVPCGGAHNDYIVTVDEKMSLPDTLFERCDGGTA